MLLKLVNPVTRILNQSCLSCRMCAVSKCYFSSGLDSKYNETEKSKILQVINDSDADSLSSTGRNFEKNHNRGNVDQLGFIQSIQALLNKPNPSKVSCFEEIDYYEVSKSNIKKFLQWKTSNGEMKTLSDIEYIDGFSERSANKLFKSILSGPNQQKSVSRIKGQILQPHLSESVIKNSNSVLAVYIAVNSVSWTLIDKENYEVKEWKYYSIDYPDGKKLQITDIFNISWSITQQLPPADIYVMKAEATTLRAAGSDPNNPKVLAVNLQKAQMVAMIVALINTRAQDMYNEEKEDEEPLSQNVQKVYFLRPTLPYRLYGTLVGNERVSTDQTVEMLLRELKERSPTKSHAYIPENLQNKFRAQKDLQKDMLGHCLLLSLTFMDLCIYRNQERIAKLNKRGE